MAKLIDRAGCGTYHIGSVDQLNELPSAIDWALRHIRNVLWIKVQAHKAGDLIDCVMWGQPITMTYGVAQYLAALSALEK